MNYLIEFIWKIENENLWLCLSNIAYVVENLLHYQSSVCNIIKNHRA